jgi:chitinase
MLAALVAVGCSGDGGTDPQQNRAPNAVIMAAPTVVAAGDNHATVVTLDGTGSSDPDGDTLSFSWTVPSGQFVNGTSATDALVQVTFPGTAPYTVTLVVNDGKGATDSASVLIDLGP